MRNTIKAIVASLPLVLLLVLGVLLGAYASSVYYTHHDTPIHTPTAPVVRGTAELVLPDNVVSLETSRDNDNNCLALVLGKGGEPDYVVRPCPPSTLLAPTNAGGGR